MFTRLFGRTDADTRRPTRCVFKLDGAGMTYTQNSIGLKPTTLELGEARIAVIGMNGSGKTTLLELLDGALEPTEGSVLVDDGQQQLSPSSHHDRRRVETLIGRVRREEIPNSFYRAKTIREALAAVLKHHHVAPSEGMTRMGGLLAHFHLSTVASQPASNLSSEQRHLLAIVSALITSPSVIVADEPTKGLDEVGTAHVADALFGFGTQVIVVTHDLDLLTNPRYGIERVIVLDEQHVVFDGEASKAVDFYNALIRERYERLRNA